MNAPHTRRSLAAAAALGTATAAVLLPAAWTTPAAAQPNPALPSIPEPMAETIHAKITALDPQARKITLQGANGRAVTVTAGPVVQLDLLKVGDTVNAQFYRSVAFELSKSMAGTPPDAGVVAVGRQAQAPGGVAVGLFRISGLVVAKHPASNSLDVVNPRGGGVYTLHITDPARIALLQDVKVGDVITAVVSDAIAVSVEKAQTSWW